jgi:thiamine-phosphate pyrophosphorylase
MIDFRFCLVTEGALRDGAGDRRAALCDAIDRACRAGVRCVQLREKALDGRELVALARDLRKVTSPTGARLTVNDRVDVAIAAGLDGVHCPESGFPAETARRLLGSDALIGVSCHSLVRLRNETAAGLAFFGPVYETPSKIAYGPPLGISALREACRSAPLPVFAIGGITPQRAVECIDAGASGVAAISAVLRSSDIAAAVGAFEKALGSL